MSLSSLPWRGLFAARAASRGVLHTDRRSRDVRDVAVRVQTGSLRRALLLLVHCTLHRARRGLEGRGAATSDACAEARRCSCTLRSGQDTTCIACMHQRVSTRRTHRELHAHAAIAVTRRYADQRLLQLHSRADWGDCDHPCVVLVWAASHVASEDTASLLLPGSHVSQAWHAHRCERKEPRGYLCMCAPGYMHRGPPDWSIKACMSA